MSRLAYNLLYRLCICTNYNDSSLLLQSENAIVCRLGFSYTSYRNGKHWLENMTAHWTCLCEEVTTLTPACLLCCPFTNLAAIFAVCKAA